MQLSCVVIYAVVMPFNNTAQNFLIKKYGMSKKDASYYMSIPYSLSAIGSPFLGAIVDRFGNRASLILVSASVVTGAHILFAFTEVNAVVPMIMMGVGYSVYA